MNRKPPKVLTSFVIVSILMGWNGISPCLQSGAGIQLSTVVWGNPVLLADEPAEQVEASAETAKQIVKRSMDLVFIIITSPVWIPVITVLCLGILVEQVLYWDFGPLFITEPRFSLGEKFDLYKINLFREHVRQRFIQESSEYKKVPTFNHLHRNPDNLSHIGKFMKKFYLDELGQIFNILRGQMSVVGPRPRPIAYKGNSYPPRQLLKTGIFCFPANHSKSGADTILKYSTDEEYLEQYQKILVWGLVKLDLSIILDGFRAILKGRG